ncbi:hypothetical protein [Microbacterium thalli]|uniref:Uncharacterized protein n=1 Tax=Microbacterium thalli TaxID=3027921 RepID=A0ABT5SG87_9MICO|nr:hypothetical protein [Microbacterium thalli]MDD7961830.1 hypothetical protein [Microbacterium thalli]
MTTSSPAQADTHRDIGAWPHDHGWVTESAHRTSEGLIRYVRCPHCGAHRVDLQPANTAPPAAASVAIDPTISRERHPSG